MQHAPENKHGSHPTERHDPVPHHSVRPRMMLNRSSGWKACRSMPRSIRSCTRRPTPCRLQGATQGCGSAGFLWRQFSQKPHLHAPPAGFEDMWAALPAMQVPCRTPLGSLCEHACMHACMHARALYL